MFSIIRKLAGGPKNRLIDDQFDLDLTYITDKIIAMAFPSQGFQQVYRNSLEDVAKFLDSKHGSNYLIINVSNRGYNYERFSGKIIDFYWPNHQTPCLQTLFKICEEGKQFLKKSQKNVIVFHCNYGKGRTGTAIMAFMRFMGIYKLLEQGLQKYHKIRFTKDEYYFYTKCQFRYLNYFQNILKNGYQIQKLVPLQLKEIKVLDIQLKDDIFFSFTSVRNNKCLLSDIRLFKNNQNPSILIGDLFIQIYEMSWLTGKKILGWINFNTNLNFSNFQEGSYIFEFEGKNIKIKSKFKKAKFIIQMKQHKCNQFDIQKCKCEPMTHSQRKYCAQINRITNQKIQQQN